MRTIGEIDDVRRAALAGVVTGGLAAALVVGCAPAFGLSERGHVFGFAFAGEGSGEGELSDPAGVAVSDAKGEVYVVDRGNNRVVQFNRAGEFVSAWGFGVRDGAREYEVCLRGEGCQAGLADPGRSREHFGIRRGELLSPEGVAVDNSQDAGDGSRGDVYVVADVVPEASYVYKFSASGEYLGRLTSSEETEFNGRVEGVTVDANGVVWVAWSDEEVTGFVEGDAKKPVGEALAAEYEGAPAPGLAVDSKDNLYVNSEPAGRFVESEEGIAGEEGRGEGGERPCEVAGSPCSVSELTTVGVEAVEGEGEALAPGEAIRRGVDSGVVRALAVDPGDDDLYVAQGDRIDAFAADGTLVQSFGSTALSAAAGVAVSSGGDVYATDAATGRVDVFVPEGPGAPMVDGLSVSGVSASSAGLGALVDPTGASTSVSFEYGPAPCTHGGCAQAPAAGGPVSAGYGDVSVAAQITALLPSSTYHFRVRAENVVESKTNVLYSDERTFTTYTASGSTLPDGRAWELVSPAEPAKNGASFEAIPAEGGLIEASEDGERLTYISSGADGGEVEGNLPPYFVQNLAQRGVSGWSSQDIAVLNGAAPGVGEGHGNEYRFFSTDLSKALVAQIDSSQSPGEPPPLSSEASELTPYLRDDEECAPAPSACYEPLVSPFSDTASPPVAFGKQINVVAATPDLNHVLLSSTVALTSEATAPGANLYEWSAGKPPDQQLQLVNVAPGGSTPVAEASVGSYDGHLARHAISEDGTRVFFTAGPHLYMRDTQTRETIQIDTPQPGANLGPREQAVFQSASVNGGRVFFTDEQRLTVNSTALPEGEGKPDLYECEITESEGRVAGCALQDLTVDQNPGESADVLGLVLEVSEDGASVYFVANGVLGSSPSPRGEAAVGGRCNAEQNQGAPPPGTCNLYVEHYDSQSGEWEAPRLIALLSSEDIPDWGRGADFLAGLSARVSPNGRYLAFMSDRELTGYDNQDTSPAADGAHDEEVFLYDSQTNLLVCASCNPSGARPTGVLDRLNSGEGLGLLIDRQQTWSLRWLAASIPGWTPNAREEASYQSRYLSNEGRLFFDSADALLPQDTNGKEDVYEYEPDGLGSCRDQAGCVALISSGSSNRESAFLDASANGDDVFFLTASALVAQDTDTSYEVYDAHVCSETSPCPAPPAGAQAPCETAETCRPGTAQQPAFNSPATARTAPSSSPPATPAGKVLASKSAKLLSKAQKLAKALTACRKLKKHKKRLACEASARKRYEPKKKKGKARKTARTRKQGAGR